MNKNSDSKTQDNYASSTSSGIPQGISVPAGSFSQASHATTEKSSKHTLSPSSHEQQPKQSHDSLFKKTKFQKKSHFNSFLPYNTDNCLDNEAYRFLSQIKDHLRKCVLLYDTQIAFSHWMHQLSRYISLYGYMFSKDDHLEFIHFFFELICTPPYFIPSSNTRSFLPIETTGLSIPSQLSTPPESVQSTSGSDSCVVLDSITIGRICRVLNNLLHKRELITPADLQLPWRPLYRLLRWVAHPNKNNEFSIERLTSSLKETIEDLVRNCRPYFPLGTTREILEEFMPKFCPFDGECSWALYYLQMFLPTISLDETTFGQTIALWFHDLMGLSLSISSYGDNEKYVFCLLVRAVEDSIAVPENSPIAIDYLPYLPNIFTKCLRHLDLPVGERQIGPALNNSKLESCWFARLIVWLLGGRNTEPVFLHLTRLIAATSSFAHPSNSGKWVESLRNFLYELADSFLQRIFLERVKKPTWFVSIPREKQLDDGVITRFVELLQPILMSLLFGKGLSQHVLDTLRILAILRPQIIIPPILNATYPALETLTEPHRLLSCLQAMTYIARSLLAPGQQVQQHQESKSSQQPDQCLNASPRLRWYSKGFPGGRQHALRVLSSTLPGLDFNDISKCFATFQFLASFLSLVPLVDCSDLVPVHRRQQKALKQRALTRITSRDHPAAEALSSPSFAAAPPSDTHAAPNEDYLPLIYTYAEPKPPTQNDDAENEFDDEPDAEGQGAHESPLRLGDEPVLDLNEEEEALCLATRQFEDFVAQFMDRVFTLLESNTVCAGAQSLAGGSASNADSNRALTNEERWLELGVSSAFECLLQQCSEPLYKFAVDKLYNFVCRGIFETKLAGATLSEMCGAACSTRPELAFPKFFKFFSRQLSETLNSDDFKDTEDQDEAVLWNLCVLSRIVMTDGRLLLEYEHELQSLLDRVLWLRSRRAANFAANALCTLLRTLTFSFVFDFTAAPYARESTARSPGLPSEATFSGATSTINWMRMNRLTTLDGRLCTELVPIRHWAESYAMNEIRLGWHVPTRDELLMAERLIRHFVKHILGVFTSFMSGERKLTREELTQHIKVLSVVIRSANIYIPPLESPLCPIYKSSVSLLDLPLKVTQDDYRFTMPEGKNIRNVILEMAHHLLDYLLVNLEDQTMSICALIDLHYDLILIHGYNAKFTDTKGHKSVKNMMANRLLGRKQHLQVVFMHRILLQHTNRILSAYPYYFTEAHMSIFENLFKLSISRYNQVRKAAQNALSGASSYFSHGRRLMLRMCSSELGRWLIESEHLKALELKEGSAAGKKSSAKEKGKPKAGKSAMVENNPTVLGENEQTGSSSEEPAMSDEEPDRDSSETHSDKPLTELDALKIKQEFVIRGLLGAVASYTGHSDLTSNSWEVRSLLWPKMARVTHEKPIIMRLLEKVVDGIIKHTSVWTPFGVIVPAHWTKLAATIFESTKPSASGPTETETDSTPSLIPDSQLPALKRTNLTPTAHALQWYERHNQLGADPRFTPNEYCALFKEDADPSALFNYSDGTQALCSAEDLHKARVQRDSITMSNISFERELKRSLLELCHSAQLPWKMEDMVLELLSVIFSPLQRAVEPEVVRAYLHGLVHDYISIRHLSVDVLGAILYIHRPKWEKQMVPIESVWERVAPWNRLPLEQGSSFKLVDAHLAPFSVSTPVPGDREKIRQTLPEQPGLRADNLWLCYDGSLNIFESEESFNAACELYSKRIWTGYYSMPKTYEVRQPRSANISNKKKTESQDILEHFFTQEKIVARLFKFLTIEDKDHTNFSTKYFQNWKGLFRNHGKVILDAVRPHIEKALHEVDPQKIEHCHLAAAESLAGLIQGAKFWPYRDVMDMWKWALPQLHYVLENHTVETQSNWSLLFSQIASHVDPKFLHPVYCLFFDRKQLKFFCEDLNFLGHSSSNSLQLELALTPSSTEQQECATATDSALTTAEPSDSTSSQGSQPAQATSPETEVQSVKTKDTAAEPAQRLRHLSSQRSLVGVMSARSASIFHMASRLFMLQGFLHQHEWRIPLFWTRIAHELDAFLDYPFKIVRERIGTLLASIYATFEYGLHRNLVDFTVSEETRTIRRSLHRSGMREFVQQVLPRLSQFAANWRAEEQKRGAEDEKSKKTKGSTPTNTTSNGSSSPVSLEKEPGGEGKPWSSQGREGTGQDHALLKSTLKLLSKASAATVEDTEVGRAHSLVPQLSGFQEVNEEELAEELDELVLLENASHEDERTRNLCFFKTVIKFFRRICEGMMAPPLCIFQLLPALCELHSEQADCEPELQQVTTDAIHAIGALHLQFNEQDLQTLLSYCSIIRSSPARKTMLGLLQCWVFHNLFYFIGHGAHTIYADNPPSTGLEPNTTPTPLLKTIKRILLGCLIDPSTEVRDAAKDTLSGLYRCGAFAVDRASLDEMYLMAERSLPARTLATDALVRSSANDALIERHAGVLCLCALVEAAPYSVPAHLPGVLMRLASHVHDPQPIAGSVRRALSHFKRTHADEWDTVHRARFSEQQLSVLTDVLVSPNYYA